MSTGVNQDGMAPSNEWEEGDWHREEEVIYAGCGILVARVLTMQIENVIRCADCYERWYIARKERSRRNPYASP